MYYEIDKRDVLIDVTKKLTCDNVKEILKFMSPWMDENKVEYIRPILPSQNSIVIACK